MEKETKQDFGSVFDRKFPRRKLTTAIGILCGGIYNIVMCVEIGEGGLQFLASERHKKGGLVVANLFLPQQHFVAVTAEIVYVNNSGEHGRSNYGVKFKNLSFEDRRHIREYISDKKASES